MTLLQPHLGEPRCQELRNSPFRPSSLFNSQLVIIKEGEAFLLKKGTLTGFRILSKQALLWSPQQEKRLLQETLLWGQLFPKQ